jgi:hypothetical protein
MTRVLVAIEPRMYQEVLVEAFRKHRPHVKVIAALDGVLNGEVGRFGSHLIVCNQGSSVIQGSDLCWVELLMNDRFLDARIGVGGRVSTISDVGMEDMLAVLDEVDSLTSEG